MKGDSQADVVPRVAGVGVWGALGEVAGDAAGHFAVAAAVVSMGIRERGKNEGEEGDAEEGRRLHIGAQL